MTLINCSKEKYREALAFAATRATRADHTILTVLAIRANFKHLADGRQISPRIWLQVLRADMRGRLALPRLLKCRDRCSAALTAALAEQRAIVQALLLQCPAFTAGLRVEEDAAPPFADVTPAQPREHAQS